MNQTTKTEIDINTEKGLLVAIGEDGKGMSELGEGDKEVQASNYKIH